MPNMFYVGQDDFIEQLNALADRVGITGPQGDPGAQTQILTGSGDPPDFVGSPDEAYGANGDYYIDTSSSTIWGPKAAGTWVGTSGGTIPGTGSFPSWFTPSDLPVSVYSVAGDLALNFDLHREIIVELDQDLTTFTITPPSDPYTMSKGPFILRITRFGSFSLGAAIWATPGAGAHVFGKALPTSIGGFGNLTIAFIYSSDGNIFHPIGYSWYSPCFDSVFSTTDVHVPTTGFSITILDGTELLVLNPSGTLSTGTVTMPPRPYDGYLIRISSTQIVTTLTLSGNSGQTVVDPITTIAVGGRTAYKYESASAKWWPA